MTNLPISLSLATVNLGGRDETGTRWTLGPTWYDDHQYDENLLPYYDDGNRELELSFDVAPEPVRNWAAQMIAKTTDYRVTGWNGLVPILCIDAHTMEIVTTAGMRMTFITTSPEARTIYGRLEEPDHVIIMKAKDGRTVRIPVRAIVAVETVVNVVNVVNNE